jgi:large subunit ribosomal protein L16
MAVRKKIIAFKNYPSTLVRYAKRHRPRLRKAIQSQLVQTGHFNLIRRRYYAAIVVQAATPGHLQPGHLDAAHRVLVRKFARLFRFWRLIRFTGMVTAKPREIRMGKGKGAFSFWVKAVEIGYPLAEFTFIKWYPIEYLYHVVRRLKAKLPIHILAYYRPPTRITRNK